MHVTVENLDSSRVGRDLHLDIFLFGDIDDSASTERYS